MNITEVKNSNEIIPTYQDFFSNEKHGASIVTHSQKYVFINTFDSINEDACIKYGYKISSIPHLGGVLVANEGDISIAHFGGFGNDWMHRFVKHIIKYCEKKGLNVIFKDNDILIDNYKVSGISITPYEHV